MFYTFLENRSNKSNNLICLIPLVSCSSLVYIAIMFPENFCFSTCLYQKAFVNKFGGSLMYNSSFTQASFESKPSYEANMLLYVCLFAFECNPLPKQVKERYIIYRE